MGMQNQSFRYRLGINVGVASLGVAILALEKGNNATTEEPGYNIFSGSVRIFPLPDGAAERRFNRLSDLLTAHGIRTPRKNVPKDILDLSPIKLRAQASREKIELAHLPRAPLHMGVTAAPARFVNRPSRKMTRKRAKSPEG